MGSRGGFGVKLKANGGGEGISGGVTEGKRGRMGFFGGGRGMGANWGSCGVWGGGNGVLWGVFGGETEGKSVYGVLWGETVGNWGPEVDLGVKVRKTEVMW